VKHDRKTHRLYFQKDFQAWIKVLQPFAIQELVASSIFSHLHCQELPNSWHKSVLAALILHLRL
jgi:hypothetical protein